MLGKKGFTLIELIVVIAIVSILASIALVNTGRNPDRDVRLEKDRFTAFLRDVQNRSLAAEARTGLTGRLCGYGVKGGSSELQVYYLRTSGSTPQDIACGPSASAGVIEEIDISGDKFVFRNGVTISNGFSANDKLFFMIPDGKVYVKGLIPDTPLSISLQKDTYTVSGIVKVDPSGRIY